MELIFIDINWQAFFPYEAEASSFYFVCSVFFFIYSSYAFLKASKIEEKYGRGWDDKKMTQYDKEKSIYYHILSRFSGRVAVVFFILFYVARSIYD